MQASRDTGTFLLDSKQETSIMLSQDGIKYPVKISNDIFKTLSTSERAVVRVLVRHNKVQIMDQEES